MNKKLIVFTLVATIVFAVLLEDVNATPVAAPVIRRRNGHRRKVEQNPECPPGMRPDSFGGCKKTFGRNKRGTDYDTIQDYNYYDDNYNYNYEN